MPRKTSVLYTSSARKDLKKLEEKDSRKIVLAISKFTEDNPLIKAKALTGIFQGLYRYRIGEYRAIFQYDKSGLLYIVTILKIKHRKDIYRR